jgi:Flp pilus assembly pilin Flp
VALDYQGVGLCREKSMPSLCLRLLRDTSGATAIEYAMVAVCIAVAIAATVATIAPKLISGFVTVTAAI